MLDLPDESEPTPPTGRRLQKSHLNRVHGNRAERTIRLSSCAALWVATRAHGVGIGSRTPLACHPNAGAMCNTHSVRNASIGLAKLAWRAGIRHASNATIARVTDVAARSAGLCAETS